MIPKNNFQSPTPEKVPNCANLSPGKIEKNHNQVIPWII